MPSWNELTKEIEKIDNKEEIGRWLTDYQFKILKKISEKRNNTNVIFYASSFLQKSQIPAFFNQITHEDINGFMSVMYGLDWKKGLTLILHTPGGITNATHTIVEYLRNKFNYIEIIIPTFAMSAGTMISLAADKIIMGRQSQLGPIDPQLPIGGRFVSARAIVDQFEKAKKDIIKDTKLAHLWAPILQSLGPALLQEARDALEYGEKLVAKWLTDRMLRDDSNAEKHGKIIAKYFNRSHKSHGSRINRDIAKNVPNSNGLRIEDLETNQEFQDDVLTAYHLITITFEKSPAAKLLVTSKDRLWVKNFSPAKIPIYPMIIKK